MEFLPTGKEWIGAVVLSPVFAIVIVWVIKSLLRLPSDALEALKTIAKNIANRPVA